MTTSIADTMVTLLNDHRFHTACRCSYFERQHLKTFWMAIRLLIGKTSLIFILANKLKGKEAMENTTWEQRLHALTHILTNPTTAPPLHSQFLVSTLIPCYLDWDYPPLLCRINHRFPSPLLKWSFSLFLKRASRLGQPLTSWRYKCPYQQPPPLLLARGVEEAQWGDEQKRELVRVRLKRKRLEWKINPLIPVLVPNLFLFSLLLWNPFPDLDS